MTALTFEEGMAGHVTLGQPDCVQGSREGKLAGSTLGHQLTIHLTDLDAFLADPEHAGRATGWVECPELGGRLEVQAGWFNLLVHDPHDAGGRRMGYRLHVRDLGGNPLTYSGVKLVSDGDGLDIWSDTTTLFVRFYAGHLGAGEEATGQILGAGLVHISHLGLARMTASFRATGPPWRRPAAVARFGRLFAGELWDVYASRAHDGVDDFPEALDGDPPALAALRQRGLTAEVVPFTAGDGVPLTLHHLRAAEAPKGPVLLVHGTGVRGTIFYAQPGAETIVDRLIAEGYDVWIENWRASIDLARRPYDLDQAAVFDHPQAVRTVREATGAQKVKVIAHCAGGSSVMMASAAGLLDGAGAIVVHGTSLHPAVSKASARKMRYLTPLAARMFTGMDPQWGEQAPTAKTKALARWITFVRRHDCDSSICHLSNYAYGVGSDVLWRHANLDKATHEWLGREFGWVPYTFFKQIARSVRRGRLVPVSGLAALPEDLAVKPKTPSAVTFLVGERNGTWSPDGQRRSFEVYDALEPGRHAFEELPGYGHFDVFLGRDAPADTFPAILAGLTRE